MRDSMPYAIVKAIGMLVVALMICAIGYAAYISVLHWHGIGV